MERKSMGQFLAALRKANGMTQQEVADRLHVSDKAVSRWERDASAPDLSLIPALAELFGVTCDELLRGERLTPTVRPEPGEGRASRQVRALLNRALSGFRTLCWVSLALSAVGLVCMLGIAFGFYRPVIGFAVMAVFAVVAVLLGVLAVNRLRTVCEDNELFGQADGEAQTAYARCLGNYSFAAFFGAVAAVALSLPLVLLRSEKFANSVLSAESYFPLAGGVGLLLLAVWMKGRPLYTAWINGQPVKWPWTRPFTPAGRMTLWQVGLTILAVALFALAPWFWTDPESASVLYIGINVAGLLCLLGNIGCFVQFMLRHPRQGLVLPGVRNGLYVVAALMAAEWHGVGFSSVNELGWGPFERYDYWDPAALFRALGLAVAVTLVAGVIRRVTNKNL